MLRFIQASQQFPISMHIMYFRPLLEFGSRVVESIQPRKLAFSPRINIISNVAMANRVFNELLCFYTNIPARLEVCTEFSING